MAEQQLSPLHPGASAPEERVGKTGAVIRLVIIVLLTLMGAYAFFRDPVIKETVYQYWAAAALMGLGVIMAIVTVIELASGPDEPL